MCSFNRGNIEGTNSSKFVSDVCVCMFYVCKVTGFVDWLDRGLIYVWEEFRDVYLLTAWVWLSWSDPVWLIGHSNPVTTTRVCVGTGFVDWLGKWFITWKEFWSMNLLMTEFDCPEVDRTLKSNDQLIFPSELGFSFLFFFSFLMCGWVLTLIYFDTDTQYAHFRGNTFCQATKRRLNNK